MGGRPEGTSPGGVAPNCSTVEQNGQRTATGAKGAAMLMGLPQAGHTKSMENPFAPAPNCPAANPVPSKHRSVYRMR
jgi:hypothetical protein